MLYTGLNENEIAKITKILDEHKINYDVSVHEEAVERINNLSEEERDKFRRQAKRSGQSLMQIEIEHIEFSKIPTVMKDRLHALGIFEEGESPFDESDFEVKPEIASQLVEKKAAGFGVKQALVLVVFIVFIVLMLVRRGM